MKHTGVLNKRKPTREEAVAAAKRFDYSELSVAFRKQLTRAERLAFWRESQLQIRRDWERKTFGKAVSTEYEPGIGDLSVLTT
jgi:hypothetical protein